MNSDEEMHLTSAAELTRWSGREAVCRQCHHACLLPSRFRWARYPQHWNCRADHCLQTLWGTALRLTASAATEASAAARRTMRFIGIAPSNCRRTSKSNCDVKGSKRKIPASRTHLKWKRPDTSCAEPFIGLVTSWDWIPACADRLNGHRIPKTAERALGSL